MPEIFPDPYIPVGSLVVSVDPDATPAWAEVAAHDGWLWTAHTKANIPLSKSEVEAAASNEKVYLPRDVGRLLALELPSKELLFSDWVRVAFRFVDARLGILRIYVLPEDQFRHLIRRESASLSSSLKQLMQSLDYSPALWSGHIGTLTSLNSLHAMRTSSVSDETNRTEKAEADVSLLQMFNTIPSPKPQTALFRDDSYQLVMDGLATSKLRGLKTTLYDYQVRSATVMLQREVCPGRVLDPRLVSYRDQSRSGRAWYYDDISGTVLREPRYYDAVAGGILAEEMGTGKTLMCLSLILATRAFPAQIPDMATTDPNDLQKQKRAGGIRSLADMAAAVVSRESVPWKLYLQDTQENASMYSKCIDAITRNPPTYTLPQFNKSLRGTTRTQAPRIQGENTITASCCSLVLVPSNLVRQWEQEIQKHTDGLVVIVVDAKRNQLPSSEEILAADILLFSMPQFENLIRFRVADGSDYRLQLDLARVHFKRVIVDEGHRLGNSKMSRKSNILLLLDCLTISSRWIVTGTPSTGLFGIDSVESVSPEIEADLPDSGSTKTKKANKATATSSATQERKDLERIGSMASLYLGMRPWANTALEKLSGAGGNDRPADWNQYMQARSDPDKSRGKECLRATLDSLIIRHRKSEIGNLLPAVVEKVVLVDGSYQDKMCLNLFSMMIIFNAVQSQRVDQDYFFHSSQQRALLQLLSNIRQSTFFGAYFYSASEIRKALETAEKFLEEKKVPISTRDEILLKEAIAFGRVAASNKFKLLADQYHEVPIFVRDLPGGTDSRAWSIDQIEADKEKETKSATCTTAPMMRALQQYLRPCLDAPHSLQAMIGSGRFAAKGRATWEEQREKQESQSEKQKTKTTKQANSSLAGNTGLGVAGSEDTSANSPLKKRAGIAPDMAVAASSLAVSVGEFGGQHIELAEPLALTQIVSTASAKLSYLIDAIVRHQSDEKIIVFYDNENTAFYLAEHLEILQIQHLIYAKGLSAERRAQYVASFNDVDPTKNAQRDFRVMLMDISQAAFGLDMWAASRMYFINPVLNPQVEAQAIGRVRRISQKRQVSVETLVLKDSIEEVIVDRRQTMTQAEHRKMRTLLDDRPIYEWVVNARIIPLDGEDKTSQMAPLETPQYLFGRGFGRVEHPDEGLVAMESVSSKRATPATDTPVSEPKDVASDRDSLPPIKKRRIIPNGVRFA